MDPTAALTPLPRGPSARDIVALMPREPDDHDDDRAPGRVGLSVGRLSAWSERHPFRAFVAIIAFFALLILALMPLARAIDDKGERMRPMYADLERMHEFQAELEDRTGAPVALTVEPGATATEEGLSFTTSAGVRLVVETTTDGYCVRGENQYGDRSKWQCLDHGDAALHFKD